MTYEAWNEMEEGDEIQIGVINENSGINGKNPGGEDGSEENSDQSEVIVNSKSSVDTVEKRKYIFWPILDACQIYTYIHPIITPDSLILFSWLIYGENFETAKKAFERDILNKNDHVISR